MAESLNIYDPRYISKLFDEMAATYGIMNLVSSFGFTAVCRRYCVSKLPSHGIENCCDLMSGMGELIPNLQQSFPKLKNLTALDLCPTMCKKIAENSGRFNVPLTILEEDIFHSSLPKEGFDCVVSSFGLKTFSSSQQRELAGVVNRILKPGGVFAFIELSLPKYIILRTPLIFYLRYVVPHVGQVFLGNPDNYRMLSVYAENFRDSSHFYLCLQDEGLEVSYLSHFFGCGTGVTGRKVS